MDEVEIKTGNCGDLIKKYLDDAEDKVIVVSPWISEGYAKRLLEKQEKGVDVTVHTSRDPSTGNHLEALRNLFTWKTDENEKSLIRKVGGTFLIIGLIFSTLFLLVEMYFFLIFGLITGILGLLLFLLGETNKGYWTTEIDNLKIYPDDLHSKIYIFDDVVIIGSANFTYTGLNKNIETILKFKDEEIREQLIQQINNQDRKTEELEETVKKIF